MPKDKDIFFLQTQQTEWEPFMPEIEGGGGQVKWLTRPGVAKGIHRAGIWRGPMPPRTEVSYDQAESVYVTAGHATIETDTGEIVELVTGDAMLIDVGATMYWTCSDDYEELFIFSGGKDA